MWAPLSRWCSGKGAAGSGAARSRRYRRHGHGLGAVARCKERTALRHEAAQSVCADHMQSVFSGEVKRKIHAGRGPAGKIEILEPSRLPMASIYFYSPHSQLFNGVKIIEKDYRGAELEISLIWKLMTQSRS